MKDKEELISISNNSSLNKRKSDNLRRADSINDNDNIFTIKEWNDCFAINSPEDINQCKLLTSLKQGIPQSIRGKVWLFLSKGFQLSLQLSPSMFDHCLLITNETTETSIKKDISRTILFNDSLSSKIKVPEDKLYNILKAYSVYDMEIEYCQGMNYIVATLLQYISNEKYVFCVLVQLMHYYRWRFLYQDRTPKLLRMMDILKEKLNKSLPDLYNHLIDNDYEVIKFFFTHFFLTLFCYNTPIDLSIRVIDLFMVYEEKILFDVILSLLSLQKEKLLLLKDEELMSYLKTDLVFKTVKEYGIDKIINYPLMN